MDTLWGIDLGGTKIEAVVVQRGTFEVLERRRLATEADQGYTHIVQRVVELVEAVEEAIGRRRPSKIGMGTPGAVEPGTGLQKNSNTVCLNGRPLRGDLSAALGIEAVLANDANCFALAEATLGAAQGYGTVFGIIMGTGVGGGLVVHGRVLEGRHGIAGEWGHNVLDPSGPDCYCGKRGCVERHLSGPALEQWHMDRFGLRLGLREIVLRARQGDPACRQTLDHLVAEFGRALSVVVDIFDPDAVVLGGGVGSIEELRTEGPEAVRRKVFNHAFHTPLLAPTLGDSAGVFGAAMLVA